jgi:hypothetical protein
LRVATTMPPSVSLDSLLSEPLWFQIISLAVQHHSLCTSINKMADDIKNRTRSRPVSSLVIQLQTISSSPLSGVLE